MNSDSLCKNPTMKYDISLYRYNSRIHIHVLDLEKCRVVYPYPISMPLSGNHKMQLIFSRNWRSWLKMEHHNIKENWRCFWNSNQQQKKLFQNLAKIKFFFCSHTQHKPRPFQQGYYSRGLIPGCFYGRKMPHLLRYKWIGRQK